MPTYGKDQPRFYSKKFLYWINFFPVSILNTFLEIKEHLISKTPIGESFCYSKNSYKGFIVGRIHIRRPWASTNFQDLPPSVHLRRKFFHPLDLRCPISNEAPISKWSKVDYYMLSTKFIVSKGWLHCWCQSQKKDFFLIIY